MRTTHFKKAPYLAARVCTEGRPYVTGEDIRVVAHPRAIRSGDGLAFCVDCGIQFVGMKGLSGLPLSRIEVAIPESESMSVAVKIIEPDELQ